MTSHLTVLRCLNPRKFPQSKVWKTDGSVGVPLGPDGKAMQAANWRHSEQPIGSIDDLAFILEELQKDPSACVIRGKLKGLPNEVDGTVRRNLDFFDDQPVHWVMVDVDKFMPLIADPVTQGADAVWEFLLCELPPEFHGASYWWQLSSSAGKPGAEGVLKAHIWFWLSEPANGATLTAWAKATGSTVDAAVFRTVQIHFTALPICEQGVVPPTEQADAERWGFQRGILADEVPLDLSPYRCDSWNGPGRRAGGAVVLSDEALAADDMLQALDVRGMIHGERGDGGYNIECPFAASHEIESAIDSTVYWPAGSGPNDYEQRHIHCLHTPCMGRPMPDYEEALGIGAGAEFERLAAEDAGAPVRWEEFGGWRAAAQRAGGANASIPGGSVDTSGNGVDAVDTVGPREIPRALFSCTDQANANRFVRRSKGSLLVAAGRWYAWTGSHWSVDEGETWRKAFKLSSYIRAEAQAKFDEANKLLASEGEEAAADARKEGKALWAWAVKSEDRSRIDAAVSLAKRVLTVPMEALDRNPWLLNCPNGTVDLRTGELKAHRKEDYITQVTRVPYDSGADAPTWRRFIATIMGEETAFDAGLPTPLAEFLQRWFGYCATGSVREQKFIVHYGGGGNGKGTMLELLTEVLGEYTAVAAPGLLMDTRSEQHPTGIADLFRRRMVTASESREGAALNEAFVKNATGADRLKARYMRGDFFEFDPSHKIQLLTNHKPVVRGQDFGIWRRMRLVPYPVRFGTVEEVAEGRATQVADRGLPDALRRELTGILSWLVAGAGAWHAFGLQEPDEVLMQTAMYQNSQDRIAQFVAECCETAPQHESVLGELYAAYQQWCKDAGSHPFARQRFASELERVVTGLRKTRDVVKVDKKTKTFQMIKGLRLLSETMD